MGRKNKKPRANADDRYIGERVRHFRRLAGLTQDDLAGPAGVTYQQLQKYESGLNRMTAVRLMKIGKALGVAIIEFIPEKYR